MAGAGGFVLKPYLKSKIFKKFFEKSKDPKIYNIHKIQNIPQTQKLY